MEKKCSIFLWKECIFQIVWTSFGLGLYIKKNFWTVFVHGRSFKKSGLDLDHNIWQSAHLWQEMSTDQDWIWLDQNWSQFWPDQDWIGLQFFWKFANQDWIVLRKFLLFRCDCSEHIKMLVANRFYRFAKSRQCRTYFSINGKRSAETISQFELYPPLPTYNVEFG